MHAIRALVAISHYATTLSLHITRAPHRCEQLYIIFAMSYTYDASRSRCLHGNMILSKLLSLHTSQYTCIVCSQCHADRDSVPPRSWYVCISRSLTYIDIEIDIEIYEYDVSGARSVALGLLRCIEIYSRSCCAQQFAQKHRAYSRTLRGYLLSSV